MFELAACVMQAQHGDYKSYVETSRLRGGMYTYMYTCSGPAVCWIDIDLPELAGRQLVYQATCRPLFRPVWIEWIKVFGRKGV